MTHEERERAEALVKLLMESEPDTFVGHVLTFSREERARVWDEAADRVGPHDDLYFEWRLKAKMLREGGRDVQDR